MASFEQALKNASSPSPSRPKIKFGHVVSSPKKASSPFSPLSFQSSRKLSDTTVSKSSNVALLSTILERNSLNDNAAKASSGKKLDHTQFTLQHWREYALLKHGDNEKFQKSPHGKSIIIAGALRDYSKDIRALCQWADDVEKAASELVSDVESERKLRVTAELKVANF